MPDRSASILVGVALLFASSAVAQPASRFTRTEPVANQPVVSDAKTGRSWQGCPVGLSDNACSTGSVTQFTWEAALAYCEDLDWGGHTDWALPDVKELRSIVDNRQSQPTIDGLAFSDAPLLWFWSSSSFANDVTQAWAVSFQVGDVFGVVKGNFGCVRCMRRAP